MVYKPLIIFVVHMELDASRGKKKPRLQTNPATNYLPITPSTNYYSLVFDRVGA